MHATTQYFGKQLFITGSQNFIPLLNFYERHLIVKITGNSYFFRPHVQWRLYFRSACWGWGVFAHFFYSIYPLHWSYFAYLPSPQQNQRDIATCTFACRQSILLSGYILGTIALHGQIPPLLFLLSCYMELQIYLLDSSSPFSSLMLHGTIDLLARFLLSFFFSHVTWNDSFNLLDAQPPITWEDISSPFPFSSYMKPQFSLMESSTPFPFCSIQNYSFTWVGYYFPYPISSTQNYSFTWVDSSSPFPFSCYRLTARGLFLLSNWKEAAFKTGTKYFSDFLRNPFISFIDLA